MSRVTAEYGKMKIEHWHAQSATQFNHEQLDYSNLLAVCMGNEGQPPADQHCDTRKADREVSRNPARAADRVEEILQFGNDGTIRSSDPIFDSDINEILNLNFSFLKNNRKEALSALLEAIGKRGQV
jgi:hypothetical protein